MINSPLGNVSSKSLINSKVISSDHWRWKEIYKIDPSTKHNKKQKIQSPVPEEGSLSLQILKTRPADK